MQSWLPPVAATLRTNTDPIYIDTVGASGTDPLDDIAILSLYRQRQDLV